MLSAVCHVEGVETFFRISSRAQATVRTNCHQFKAEHCHRCWRESQQVSLCGISGKRAFPIVFQIRVLLLRTRWRSPYCCLHPSFLLDFGSWSANKEDQTTLFSCHPPTRNGLVWHPGHHWTQYAPDRVSVLLAPHFHEEMMHSVGTVKGRKIWNIKSWLSVLVMNWVYIW